MSFLNAADQILLSRMAIRNLRVTMGDGDALIRIAAFDDVRKLEEIHDHLTADESKLSFVF